MPDQFGNSTCIDDPALFCPPPPWDLIDDITEQDGDPVIYWYGGTDEAGRSQEPECCYILNLEERGSSI